MMEFNSTIFLYTDTLPNEVPLIFNNSALFNHIHNDTKWNCVGDYLNKSSVPYTFLIFKNASDKRKISLMHPFAMLQLTKFINEYDRYLIDYFKRNKIYSIRHIMDFNKKFEIPITFYDQMNAILDSNYEEKTNAIVDFVGNYFKLGKFIKITDFYKSYFLRDLELKYKYMGKIDFSKCFDSIYTHSLDWAFYGDKNISKDNISNKKRFAYKLDRICQVINYNETSGIITGPEFSRMAAEVVLNRIDRNVYDDLKKQGLIFKTDYEIIRYMDDIFIFTNIEDNLQLILRTIEKRAYEYKLTFNKNKYKLEKKPFFKDHNWVIEIKNTIAKFSGFLNKEYLEKTYNYRIFDNFLYEFKLIISKYEEQRGYIITYLLSTFENKIISILDIFKLFVESKRNVFYTSKFIEVIMYIFSFDIKYENTTRVSLILLKIQMLQRDNCNEIYDVIYKKVYWILKYNLNKKIELMNLFLVLSFNGNDLPSQFLSDYIKESNDYFINSVITFYIIKKKSSEYYHESLTSINSWLYDILSYWGKRFELFKKSEDKLTISALLDEGFYSVHDFYSSGVMDKKNQDLVKKFKDKLRTIDNKSSNKNELEYYFIHYIKGFDKPFMNWTMDETDLLARFVIKKVSRSRESVY